MVERGEEMVGPTHGILSTERGVCGGFAAGIEFEMEFRRTLKNVCVD